MAIRWLLQKNVVSSVIIGANNLDQLEDNVGATGVWRLSKDQVIFLTFKKQNDIIGGFRMFPWFYLQVFFSFHDTCMFSK